MTQQFTKEDYQAQLYYLNTSLGIRDNSAYKIYDERVIRSALQLAIAAQPRPIEDLGEKIQSRYRIVLSDGHTHFYDLSFLPKPQERKD